MPRTSHRQALIRDLVLSVATQRHLESAHFADHLAALMDDDDNGALGSDSSDSDDAASSMGDDDLPDVLADDGDDDELIIETLFPAASDELFASLATILSQRYLTQPEPISKPTQSTIDFVLTVSRHERPAIFRSYFRVDPDSFDTLVAAIEGYPEFHNESDNMQISVAKQLAVTLYRMGHFGNAAGVLKVMILSGLGFGTVQLVARRVQHALSSEEFRKSAVIMPDEREKEAAKAEVEALSCPAWRDGHMLVDGYLFVFYSKPGHFGVSWYDRKSNYSMNAQIISTPDCRIRDFSVGLPGSQHDATAWKRSWVYQNAETVFKPGEFIWADSAYPLQSWLCAPFKKPERDEPENARFNYHVSRVRVRSEHCIGYLKGRFQSLRGLRIRIDKPEDIDRAEAWIISCICVHNFAMMHEKSADFSVDEFFKKGRKIMKKERKERARVREQLAEEATQHDAERHRQRDVELAKGKELRLQLKASLREAHGW